MRAPTSLANVHDLLDWLNAVRQHGATRFELWMKPRGAEQRAVHGFEPTADLWDVADAALAFAHRDRRFEQGFVSYAVYGVRDEDGAGPVLIDRAVLAPPAALAVPGAAGELAPAGHSAYAEPTSALLMPVLSTVQATFQLLQRENEHQRKSNEAHVQASTGHFDALARGYERTFQELQRRLDAALAEAQALRETNAALEAAAHELERTALAGLQSASDMIEELSKGREKEIFRAQRDARRETLLHNAAKMSFPVAMHLVSKFIKGTSSEDAHQAVQREAITQFLSTISREQYATIFGCLHPLQRDIIRTHLRPYVRFDENGAPMAPVDDPAPAPGAPSGATAPATRAEAPPTPSGAASDGANASDPPAPPSPPSPAGEAASAPPPERAGAPVAGSEGETVGSPRPAHDAGPSAGAEPSPESRSK